MSIKKNKLIKVLVLESWWFVLFMLLSFVVYTQAIKGKNGEISEYRNKLAFLQQEKIKQVRKNEELNLMINSLGDSSWVEIILMRDLGVVPEGKLKICFTSDN